MKSTMQGAAAPQLSQKLQLSGLLELETGPIRLVRPANIAELPRFDEVSIETVRAWFVLLDRLKTRPCPLCRARAGRSCTLKGSAWPILSEFVHEARIVSALLTDPAEVELRVEAATAAHAAQQCAHGPQTGDPRPAHPIPQPPAPWAPAGRRLRVIEVMRSSLDERLRVALAELTVETPPETVREALAAAGLHLDIATVTAWLASLSTERSAS